MNAKVIDTNVLIVANGKAEQASLDCFSSCITALDEARQQLVVVDDAFAIFREYLNEVSPTGQPGAGDAFLRWLLQNWMNPVYCEAVVLTPNVGSSFNEFPHDSDLADFDRSDHKFVAVANVSVNSPTILNAVDSDWWIHEKVLERNRIKICHLCVEKMILWTETEEQK